MKKDIHPVDTKAKTIKTSIEKKDTSSVLSHYETCVKMNTIMEKNRQDRIKGYR